MRCNQMCCSVRCLRNQTIEVTINVAGFQTIAVLVDTVSWNVKLEVVDGRVDVVAVAIQCAYSISVLIVVIEAITVGVHPIIEFVKGPWENGSIVVVAV